MRLILKSVLPLSLSLFAEVGSCGLNDYGIDNGLPDIKNSDELSSAGTIGLLKYLILSDSYPHNSLH